MNLFIAPHNDDEALFGAFTLMREHPLVVIVTDSWIQRNRGTSITADERWLETKNAMDSLGCSVIRLGIRDDVIDEWSVKDKLSRFYGFDHVYAPAVQGGNKDHDLIGKIAEEIFGHTMTVVFKQYSTYASGEFYNPGHIPVTPTEQEIELKNKALQFYTSQLRINPQHFEAVKGKPEWFI